MSFNSLLKCLLTLFAVLSAIPILTEAHPLATDSDCIIQVKKDLGEPQPLLLNPRTDEFLFPKTSDGEIEFSQGDGIKMYCTHGFRSPFDGKKSIMASCVAGKQFKVDNNLVDVSRLVCIQYPEHNVRRTNDKCTDGIIAEIGFQTDRKWLHLMRVCHNETIGSTNWVQYKQNPANRGYQHAIKQVDFVQGDFYQGLKVNDLYSRNVQRETCSIILQSKPLCMNLMPNGGDYFLSRGHLAARSDFIYTTHQRASYYFLNVASQWQSLNGANWNILEEHLRRYIDQQNLNAEIHTGTYGIVQYDDRKGISRDMYLSSNEKTKFQKIPVPKIYYKMVVADNDAGIVFIGVNNPYADEAEIKRNYIFCENVISKVNYIPWKPNLRLGHIYACPNDEFVKFVPNAPKVPKINRILL
ncbi:uncharacterized protein LOC129571388 [Sitodiplosis mosellana]|uniref:uncharacterized protein LOC129571388 n=1 Tax=Sitodiplosis mosellana TaxID=263140 RepID=UPI002443C5FA|nr:uncharacterized protein LOC129571388 [Sitodiplosis mosellana]